MPEGRDAFLRRLRNEERRPREDAGDDWQPQDDDPDYERPPQGDHSEHRIVKLPGDGWRGVCKTCGFTSQPFRHMLDAGAAMTDHFEERRLLATEKEAE